MLTLREWDPVAAEGISQLEAALRKRYGSVHDGWNKAFTSGAGVHEHVSKASFAKACAGVGVSAPSALFRAVLPTPGARSIAYADIWRNVNKIGTTTNVPEYIPFGPGCAAIL